jgi:hypothetical protein
MSNLPAALDLIAAAQRLSIRDREYVNCVRTADDFLQQMVSAIVAVRRNVTPEFFTGVMRPYFDPKVIGGRTYLAPGGAQMPLIVLDHLLWGIGRTDALYVRYFFENLEYQPDYVRELAVRSARWPSLLDRAREELAMAEDSGGTAGSSVRSLTRITATLKKFRAPHLVVARDNFQLRPQDALGSGGYQPTILEYLADETKRAHEAARSLLIAASDSNREE